MIRVALYDKNVAEARKLRRVMGSYCASCGISNVGIRIGNSYESFIDIVQKMDAGFFDMILIRVSMAGDTVIDKLENLLGIINEASPQTDVIVLSDDSAHAFNSYEVGARFLKMPFDETSFKSTIGDSLYHAAAVKKRPFPIKSGKSVMVMNLSDIMFAETGKRGPIIHLPNNRTIPVQGTLQALFDRLASIDGKSFLRAGGSFIVNLDNIRSANGDSVIFANGETIILPVRSRKPVTEAFDSWRLRLATDS